MLEMAWRIIIMKKVINPFSVQFSIYVAVRTNDFWIVDCMFELTISATYLLVCSSRQKLLQQSTDEFPFLNGSYHL